ncbi:hypothetical protein [Salipiger mucosus]|uniref:Uncharacterized protein n=1 Tax=Salipiger mucosus DSM 16094 TaxID=1123237 RepID=S9QEY2_9RHOB|nr:hypothetical protein [Salipiger mucosus]EPX78103.1 hypothetical protein Salmuc_03452 [Salipiger mucosus DSM 16094]
MNLRYAIYSALCCGVFAASVAFMDFEAAKTDVTWPGGGME